MWSFVYLFSILLGIYIGVIAVPWDNFIFNFMKNRQNSFTVVVLFYIPTKKCEVSVHLFSHQCFSIFFMLAILVGMKCYLIVVLMCIFWITNDIVQFFKCVLAICILSLEKFFAPFWIVLSFYYWVRIIYIFWILFLIRDIICKYILPFYRLYFHFLDKDFYV